MRARLKKLPLLLGENDKEGIIKGVPKIAGDCFWCDEPVWSSSVAYSTNTPDKDADIRGMKVKPLHKMCLIDLLNTGKEVMVALEMNLRSRGEL